MKERDAQIQQLNEELELLKQQLELQKDEINTEHDKKLQQVIKKYEGIITQQELKMQSVNDELTETQEAFRSYKIRAHSAIKQKETEQPKNPEQDELIVELKRQISMLKKKVEDMNTLFVELQTAHSNNEQLAQEMVELQRKNMELNNKMDKMKEDFKQKELTFRENYDRLSQEHQELLRKQEERKKDSLSSIISLILWRQSDALSPQNQRNDQ